MIIKQMLEKQGNFLFRYRGQVPVLLFIMVIPFIFTTDYTQYADAGRYIDFFSAAISLTGFVVRCLATGYKLPGTSGRNRDKQFAEFINTTGIYSVVRHPLYLGNFLMWFGLSVYTFNILFVAVLVVFFFLMYERIMFAEEIFLEKQYGVDFLYWAAITPAFFPSFNHFKKSGRPFSFRRVLANEYSGLLALVFAFVYVDALRDWSINGKFLADYDKLFILGITAFLVLVLRYMKRHTSLLKYE